MLTKQPGSPHSQVCVKIRELLLDPSSIISCNSSLFLFMADCAQSLEITAGHLALGKIVLSDRSYLSTYVYHTALERDFIDTDCDKSIFSMLDYAQVICPNLSIVLNTDHLWAANKMNERNSLDRIERFGPEFHQRVHTLFNKENITSLLSNLKKVPQDITFIDSVGKVPAETIANYVFELILNKLEGDR